MNFSDWINSIQVVVIENELQVLSFLATFRPEREITRLFQSALSVSPSAIKSCSVVTCHICSNDETSVMVSFEVLFPENCSYYGN